MNSSPPRREYVTSLVPGQSNECSEEKTRDTMMKSKILDGRLLRENHIEIANSGDE